MSQNRTNQGLLLGPFCRLTGTSLEPLANFQTVSLRSWVNSANLATAAATHSSRPDGRNTIAERTPNRSVRKLPVVDPRGENAGGFATIGRRRCSRKREGRDGRPIERGRTDCGVGALRR